jgi:hypothetical protein
MFPYDVGTRKNWQETALAFPKQASNGALKIMRPQRIAVFPS